MSTVSVATVSSVATIKSSTSAPPSFQNSSAVEVGQLCRAWVNFNGTGTPAIRDSFNVTSLTDNGAGDFTVTLTNAMPTANYAAVISNSLTAAGGSPTGSNVFSNSGGSNTAPTTTALRLYFTIPGTGNVDPEYITVAIFGD